MPLAHLADFKGKKIRVLGSDFQKTAMERLGVTPVAMSLGDVLPALNQGAIDGSIAGITVFTTMHFWDAAKYINETNQPTIFLVLEFSKRWYDALPPDLRLILDKAADDEIQANKPTAREMFKDAGKQWTDNGGQLVNLSPAEHAEMMKLMSDSAAELAKRKPEVAAAYGIVTEAAKRTR
jgi:TRAP-type C4-dicarboxylate transport system substrate-binding protein